MKSRKIMQKKSFSSAKSIFTHSHDSSTFKNLFVVADIQTMLSWGGKYAFGVWENKVDEKYFQFL